MVLNFGESHGISSEISYFNEREFKELMNRILDNWMEEMNVNNDGSISKQEFYRNICKVYGWQAWLAKPSIKKTFDNFIRHVDINGDQRLSKEELKLLIKKFAVGELDPVEVFEIPSIVKLF